MGQRSPHRFAGTSAPPGDGRPPASSSAPARRSRVRPCRSPRRGTCPARPSTGNGNPPPSTTRGVSPGRAGARNELAQPGRDGWAGTVEPGWLGRDGWARTVGPGRAGPTTHQGTRPTAVERRRVPRASEINGGGAEPSTAPRLRRRRPPGPGPGDPRCRLGCSRAPRRPLTGRRICRARRPASESNCARGPPGSSPNGLLNRRPLRVRANLKLRPCLRIRSGGMVTRRARELTRTRRPGTLGRAWLRAGPPAHSGPAASRHPSHRD